MNIFYLSRSPALAAQYLHDKHVVKMTLETAQIMSTVYWMHGKEAPYRPTHQSHPSVVWAAESAEHYLWLAEHGSMLAMEYTHRYGKVHACEVVIRSLQTPPMAALGWREPPQAMPEEFRDDNAVTAYRNYYLSRKVFQSRWTLREAPDFVKESEMAKSKTSAAKTAAATEATQTTAPTTDNPTGAAQTSDAPAAPAIPRTRGPKGVGEGAKITLLVQTNPKRAGSKAEAVFSCYKDGMTVGEFCDAVDALGPQHKGAGTPNLGYDSKHGFISIEGYNVPGGVITPKPKAPPKPKAEKKAKAPTSDDPAGEATQTSAEDSAAAANAVEEAASEETM